ncbi:MAG: carbonic anhydrase [Candidatus Omnitrophota bacterium]
MNRLIPINKISDIPAKYRATPIGRLLEYQNLSRPFKPYSQAQLLIGMCMDSRKLLHIPDNFAFVLRTGGANLRYSEFKVSYAIAVGDVSHVALITHDHCGMVNLPARKDLFVKGLVRNGGWKKRDAEEHFRNSSHLFEIGNETDFVLSEAKRLRLRYPKVTVAPMFYKVQNGRLFLLKE